MIGDLPPRSFTDFTVPTRPDGSPLSSCQQPNDYMNYVRWLSDYLHIADLPLTPDQQQWLDAQTSKEPDHIVFECSETYGFALDDLEGLSYRFEEEQPYDQYRAEMHSYWAEQYSSAVEQEEFPFEDWLDLPESTFIRLRKEWEVEQQIEEPWSHADIPFRPLLNWALKQLPDAEARFKVMDLYFNNFSDNASK